MTSGLIALLKKYRLPLITLLPFLGVWIWALRFNPLTHIPAYGDTLEVVWGANWYADSIRQLTNPLFFPKVFYPTGWPTALLAHTPIFLLLMGITRLALPPAAVYNVFVFASFLVAYLGMLRLARLYTDKYGIALLVALLYAFWGMRWVRLAGHLNVLWLSALLPWLGWILMSALNDRRKILFAAICWTFCIISSLYGIWFGAVIMGIYFLSKPRKETFRQVILISALTLLFSLPTLIFFWQARQLTGSPFFDLEHISGWGASLNSLPIPAVHRPWLATFVRKIYPGPLDESSVANLGPLALILALIALVSVRPRGNRHRFAVLLLVGGLLLSLGPVLRWSGQVIQVPLLAPVNRILWGLGAALKPHLFMGDIPTSLEAALPLPAWLLYATVPFFEGSRTVVRFAFIGGIGLLLMVAQVLDKVNVSWLLFLLAILLLLESAPWPRELAVPLPAEPHPAFNWLAEQKGGSNEAVLDLEPTGDRLSLLISGETLYAVDLHNKPTASGVSSMWPESAWFLQNWLLKHQQPLQHAELPLILNSYGINWILLHMKEGQVQQLAHDSFLDDLQLVGCFEAGDAPSPWPYPICILEVQHDGSPFDVDLLNGWSPAEPWGRWALGRESSARWVVPSVKDYELLIEVFPHCVEGRQQTMEINVNATQIGDVRFTGCDPYTGRFPIAAELLEVGWNQLSLNYHYAVAPADLSADENPDSRPLSVGFSSLEFRPKAP